MAKNKNWQKNTEETPQSQEEQTQTEQTGAGQEELAGQETAEQNTGAINPDIEQTEQKDNLEVNEPTETQQDENVATQEDASATEDDSEEGEVQGDELDKATEEAGAGELGEGEQEGEQGRGNTPDLETVDEVAYLPETDNSKKSIAYTIENYKKITITAEEKAQTSVYYTEDDFKAKKAIESIYNAFPNKNTIEGKILSAALIYAGDASALRNQGLFMQVVVKELNNAKTINDIDLIMFILCRIFRDITMFNVRNFLKINAGYNAAFKMSACQFVEFSSSLATANDRKTKIGKTISLQRVFGVTDSFLNINGSKLVIEYFSK